MKTNSKIWFLSIICLLLVGVNVYNLYNRNKLIDKFGKLSISCKNNSIKMGALKKNIISRELFTAENEGTRINGEIILNYGPEGKQHILLKDLIGNQTKFVFNYSELNCQVCVDSQVKYVRQLAAEVGVDKIVILATYKNQRDLYLFKRLHNLNIEIYNKHEQTLGLGEEEMTVPVLFITDQSLKSNYVFVPDKTIPELSKGYYKFIENKLL